jgi:ABC-type sugar transport system ATPase subunit
MYPPRSSHLGEPGLEARGVISAGLSDPVSLAVRRGEILGLAGQLGSGSAALLRALAGSRARGGEVRVAGAVLPSHQVSRAVRQGLAYCSADRKEDGLFLIRSVAENLTAPAIGRVTRAGWLSHRRERRLARQIATEFTVDLKRLGSPTGQLSGGNQQKVALGKWMSPQPTVLLVDEPTRGVDVGARAEIYRHLRQLAEGGLAVMFASSDIQEVLGLADTVATFYRGRLVTVSPVEHTDAARVLREVTHPDGDRRDAA